MKKCDIRFKVENDLTTIGAVDESNNIQDITAVTEYKNQFDKEARFFYNYKKEVFAFDGYQLKFNESNLKEFNKIQKNENNYYRTRLGDNLVTVRENLEVFVEQGLNSVENFNFKDKENKLFDKGIPFENISIEQRQALSKQNIIYPANIINKTDLPIEIKNYVNLYNQYISLNSSNRANFATNRSVINENTVLYLDSANKLNYIMAASDLASLEESEVHGNNYLSIALAQRGEQEDVNISESVSDNPVYAKRIKELKTELKELVDKRGRVLPGKERQYNNAKKHLAFLEQSVSGQMRSAIILFLQENKIKVNYSLANSLYEIAIKSDTTADFHEKMQDRFFNDIKLPFAFSYFDSWGMPISELMKKEYNRINTESKKFDGKDGIYIERTHRAKDFNDYIRKNGDRQTKYIWKLIKNVAFKINPKIKFVFEENFRGTNYAEAFTQDQTNFKSTRIEIRASLLQNPKRAAATLVHEIIHSIAHNIIDIVVLNEKKQIHLLTERQINAVKELTKLIKEVQANDKTNKFYGATDAHELLSELTNKEFVEALKEKAPNIFRRIQNFFLNILGIEKNKYRRAEAILKDIISKPVHITEIGNTIYPGLFLQKTFYKNDFLGKPDSVKSGVEELFNENLELASIGTQEQYSQYLDTIFPDSKVKDIVYHGTLPQNKFEKFDKQKGTNLSGEYGGIHFGDLTAAIERPTKIVKAENFLTGIEEDLSNFKPNIIPVILNIDNIKRVEEGKNWGQGDWSNLISKENEADGYVYTNKIENKGKDSYVVFEPEQIHILGSKADIQGFKEFVQKDNSSEINSSVSDDIDLKQFTEVFGENVEVQESDVEAKVRQLEKEGLLEIDCSKVKAKDGIRGKFTKGSQWEIYEIFEGKSHKQGGIEINIKNNQINFTNKNGSIKAKYGLVISKDN